MRPTHIERRITEKVHDWLASIDDEDLREFLQDQIVVMGGAIVSLLLDEKPNDFDVYFKTKEAALRVARYYVEKFNTLACNIIKFNGIEKIVDIKVVERGDGRVMVMVKSAGVAREGGAEDYQYFEMIQDEAERQATVEGFVHGSAKAPEPDVAGTTLTGEEIRLESYRPVFLTTNAITLSDDVQLVIRFYGTPSEIHDTYDFEHCKNYWCSWRKPGRRLTLLKSALISVLNKQLVYTGSRYPLASLFRLRKFHKRGWYYSLGETLKIAMNLEDFDLTDPVVLEDQLIGMDVAYFHEIIDRVKREGLEKIDSTYIAQLVDELY